ncbi:MAG TPA: Ig-like domain-containing protein, partial [Thermomicrobiales bacterium]|nr:Ig-like domain-containing protein [Thermomicrobiales bacterium]
MAGRTGIRNSVLLAMLLALLLALSLVPAPVGAVVYKGVDFPGGASSFADQVVSFTSGTFPNSTTRNGVPANALGPPSAQSGNNALGDAVSLGNGGSITVRFTDNYLNGNGTSAPDLWIFEVGDDTELTTVEVSTNGVNWTSVGSTTGQTSGIDIDRYGFGASARLYFVRVTDILNDKLASGVYSGADIDAVGAITSAENRTPTAVADTFAATEDTTLTVSTRATGVLRNDTDPDTGQTATLTATLVTGPTNGTVTLNSDGTFSYVPRANFNGTDTFTYAAVDTEGARAEATVTITVAAVNDPPVGVADTYTTPEDTPLVVAAPGVLANDTDIDGDTLTVTGITTQPANGTLVRQANGSFTYTPNVNFNGQDFFEYTISDGKGGAGSARANIQVTPVNDAPIANPDRYGTSEDTPLTISAPGVLANDTDIDSTSLTISAFTQPANGTVVLSGTAGGFTYTPRANFNGTDTFTYTVSDGGLTATGTVTIDVAAVNDPPVANDDAYSTTQNTPLRVAAPGVSGNDTDAEGNPITVAVLTAPPATAGMLTLSADGSFVFTPVRTFSGQTSFTYRASDGNGGVDDATVTITVNATAQDPVAASDSYSLDEDTTLTVPAATGVLSNDRDPQNDAITVVDPGTLTGSAGGSLLLNANGSFTYTPVANYSGTETFTYRIQDTGGGQSAPATISFTVRPVNDAPTARNDSYSTDEDTPITISAPGVLSNDSDIDGDTLTVASNSTPANGTVSLSGTGRLIYTPNPNFTGTDTFTYTARDPGGLTSTATVTVEVRAVNDVPVAIDDAYSVAEDGTLTVPVGTGVLANDRDVDGDSLTVGLVTRPTNGQIVLAADGSFVYTPNPDFNGIDAFTYTARDASGASDTATVQITVTPVNDAPDASDDGYTVDEDATLTIPAGTGVLANDRDVDGDPLSVAVIQTTANGTLTLSADGSFGYAPNANFVGVDRFTYRASDGRGGTDTATATITVLSVNDPPVARADSASTDEDTAVSVNVLANDSDIDGNTLSIASFDQPTNGVVTRSSTFGTLVYTPNANFSGTDSFIYTISDGQGGVDSAVVTITVRPVNDAPAANDDAYETSENVALVVPAPGILGNDTDPDNTTFTISITTQPANGRLTLTGSTGGFRYQPNLGFNGTDSFTYRITDAGGSSDTATVTIGVAAVENDPVAQDDAYTTAEDATLTVGNVSSGVLGNDADPVGQGLTVELVAQAANGRVTLNADGTFTYAPNANYNGPDEFTYRITDASGASDTAIARITVTPVNDAPVAANDRVTVDEDAAPFVVDVLGNDQDIDGDTLSIVSFTGGQGFELSRPTSGPNAGRLVVTLSQDFQGDTSFQYTISDSKGLQSTATMFLTVRAQADPPVAGNDSATTSEDAAVTIPVLRNDTDPDGDTLSVAAGSIGAGTGGVAPANGTATINGDGTITYTPNPNFSGTDTFTYLVSDGNGGTGLGRVTVTVSEVNDPPVVIDTSEVVIAEDAQSVEIDVLARVSDPDTNPVDRLTITSVTQAVRGTVVLNDDGTLTYFTPDRNFFGEDSFTYTVSDGRGGFVSETIVIQITAVEDDPFAVDDRFQTPEDTDLVLIQAQLLANDGDVDGDTLTIVSVGEAVNGTVILNDDGTIAFTPAEDFNGTASFSYTIDDGTGRTASATVTVDVLPVTDQPVAGDDSFTMNEDDELSGDLTPNDVNPDGDGETYALLEQATNGTAAINDDGTFTYTPNLNFFGTDTFSYTPTNGSGESTSAVVTIVVNPVADAPSGTPDSYTTAEDTIFRVSGPGVLGNDTDVDSPELLVIAGYTQPAGGTVSLSGDGSFIFTPNPDFFGPTTFTYNIADETGLRFDDILVTINVTSSNDAPVAVEDDLTTAEDVALTFDPRTNDTDADPGDAAALTIVSVTQPESGVGQVSINADGTLTFTPAANFNGLAVFTYTIADPSGARSVGSIEIEVTAVNDAPVAVDDVFTEPEADSFDLAVLDNDSDPDVNDLLIVAATTQSGAGTVSVADDGKSVIFTPTNPDFNGRVTFQYTVEDAAGATATATVTLNITAVPDAPDAVDDSATLPENATRTYPISVLGNDTDADGDALYVSAVTQPASGFVTFSPDGQLVYTSPAGFTGTVTFTYTVSDPSGRTDQGIVTLNVNYENLRPVAVDDVEGNTFAEGSEAIVDVLANDSDLNDTEPGAGVPYQESLRITTVTDPVAAGTSEIVGTVEIVGGSIRFVPTDPYFNGNVTFSYTISDLGGLTDTADVALTITPVNDLPVAGDDTAETNEETPVTIAVLGNDTDPDTSTTLTVTGFAQPPSTQGSVVAGANNTLVFTPAPDFNGTVTFTYTVSDGNGGTDTAIVTVTVLPVNDTPQTNADVVSTREDTPVTIDVLANDVDIDGDAISIDGETLTQPANGTIELLNGAIVYTPNPNFNGTDSFTYRVTDGNGALTEPETVSIVVSPANDAPIATNGTASTDEDVPATGSVASLATDVDVASNGDVLTFSVGSQGTNGSVTIAPNGDFVYTPRDGFNGTDRFSYVVTDQAGATATGFITVTVAAVNDAPVVLAGSRSTPEDVPFSGALAPLASDIDSATLTFALVTGPANATVVVSPDGTFTFTPNPDFNGTTSFTFSVDDGAGGVTEGTFSINVTPVNDAPVATPGSFETDEDAPLTDTLAPLASDIDPGDQLSFVLAVAPTSGTVTIASDGTFTYTPNPEANGTDTFTYRVSDGRGGSDTGTVTITITAANDAPVANPDGRTYARQNDYTIDVVANDTDVDRDTLSVAAGSLSEPTSGGQAVGSLDVNADGDIVFTPIVEGFTGIVTFTYRVTDGTAVSEPATVVLDIGGGNEPPVAEDDSFPVSGEQGPIFEGATVLLDVLANDSDPNPFDTLVIDPASLSDPVSGGETVGTLAVVNNQVQFTPTDPDFNGTVTFTYRASDGIVASGDATVTFVVTPVNDGPTASAASYATSEDTRLVVPVGTGLRTVVADIDDPQAALTITVAQQPTRGTLLLRTDGSFDYLPGLNANGTDTFTYTVTDPSGLQTTATVTIEISAVNDPPDVQVRAIQTAEDSPFNGSVAGQAMDVDGDTLTFERPDGPTLQGGTVTLAPDGTFTYTPAPNFAGTDSFTYTVSDGTATSSGRVTITVTPVNDPPVVTPVDQMIAEDTRLTGNLADFVEDVDGGAPTFTLLTPVGEIPGTFALNGDGTFSFTPNANYNNDDGFTLRFRVSDGIDQVEFDLIITVTATNDAPIAADDNYARPEADSVALLVLGNDSDPDGDAISIVADSISTPVRQGTGQAAGTAVLGTDGSGNPAIVFTPIDPNFNGVVTFTYQVEDAAGLRSGSATVTLTVTPVNDLPVVTPENLSTTEDTPLSGDLSDFVEDVDGGTPTFTLLTDPATIPGTFALNPDGTFTFTPTPNVSTDETGPVTLRFSVTDGTDAVEFQLTLAVTAIGDAPVANDDALSLDESNDAQPIYPVPVVANDTDVDSDTLTVVPGSVSV